jgi:ubiquinone/menaquinone biosynthesis C-methylase UbiE
MQRIPEPELMDTDAQAAAYAHADFEQPHNMFIQLFREAFPGVAPAGHVLDLGCGPADISIRFVRAFPGCTIDAVDGAAQMLKYGRIAVDEAGLGQRIRLIQAYLPSVTLPRTTYDVVISNSLLHHLREPMVLWNTVEHFAGAGAPVFIMDLMRPDRVDRARELVEEYASGEPDVLRQDFFNSLLAAYTVDEVRQQLEHTGLDHLDVQAASDRHLIISGRLEPVGVSGSGLRVSS